MYDFLADDDFYAKKYLVCKIASIIFCEYRGSILNFDLLEIKLQYKM